MKKLGICAAALAALASVASGQTPLTTVRIYPTSGGTALFRPLFATSPPGDTVRFFVVEQRTGSSGAAAQTGRIQILDLTTNALLPGPFFTVTGMNTGNEEGLLGMAFSPEFYAAAPNPNRGAFFVYYTTGGNNRVVRYTTTGQDPNADTADLSSGQLVIEFSHPSFSNHNGGWIGFGPDGYLYIATGDGGSSCDPSNNGQNINTLLGKMIRLDVSADQNGSTTIWGYLNPPTNPFFGATPGADEVFHYGLRNPWRNSFDRLTGDMYIGDVGQGTREEIDYVAAGTSGLNFGWDIREGFVCSSSSGCSSTCATGFAEPVWDYPRSSGFSVTGGYVYRGSRIADLQGTYFFADYGSARIWTFRITDAPLVPAEVPERTSELAPTVQPAGTPSGFSIASISSFAEDESGELYIIDQNGGEIFKIQVNCGGSSLTIPSPPSSQTVCVGANVVFTVGASGARGTTTYQWRKNTIPLGPPSTSSTLNLTGVTPADAGSYDVIVTDQCNSATSSAATLTVVDNPSADAGGPYTMCTAGVAYALNGSAGSASSVNWTTTGTGAFGNPSMAATTYTPSAADLIAGSVLLTLSADAIAPCTGTATSQVTVNFVARPDADITGDCVEDAADDAAMVALLLDLDFDPGRTQRADYDGNLVVDGNDVQFYVAARLGP